MLLFAQVTLIFFLFPIFLHGPLDQDLVAIECVGRARQNPHFHARAGSKKKICHDRKPSLSEYHNSRCAKYPFSLNDISYWHG
jgi:hypothetical protein